MTTDHMDLRGVQNIREELAHAKDKGNLEIEVRCIDLVELLAAYDALVAAGSKPKKATGYSAEFEQAWLEYPPRPGNSKAAAYKAWKARLAAGATVLEMIEGTRKYAVYCKVEGTEPQYVKQAATFYGPGEHFTADWTPRAEQRRTIPDRRTPPPESTDQAEARRKRWGLQPSAVGDGDAPY